MARGFLYLVAVMDWVSRYVLAWRLSNLLEVSFCIEVLEEADHVESTRTDLASALTSALAILRGEVEGDEDDSGDDDE